MKWLFLAGVVLAGCPKDPPAPAPPTSSATPAPSSAPGLAASAAPTASAQAAGPVTYVGKYTSKEGSLYVPDGGEWAGVKWRGDDASVGIGDGTLSLTVDPKSGRAEGSGDGAFGPVVLAGMLDKDRLTFTLARKDRADEGFTGSAMGKLTGDKLEGTMKLSLASASVIREASFSLAKK